MSRQVRAQRRPKPLFFVQLSRTFGEYLEGEGLYLGRGVRVAQHYDAVQHLVGDRKHFDTRPSREKRRDEPGR